LVVFYDAQPLFSVLAINGFLGALDRLFGFVVGRRDDLNKV
jgi:hypothetical protein